MDKMKPMAMDKSRSLIIGWPMLTPGKIILGIICGIVGGAVFFAEAAHIFVVRNAPIVMGHIIARKPIRQFITPRADFTIRIEGADTVVHARVQRYLMNDVPDDVRFHYSGDPAREVFLFEYEENPYWIVLLCWGIASLLIVLLVTSHKSARIRKIFGMKENISHGTTT